MPAQGYCPKFGLFAVNRSSPSLERRARPTAALFAAVARTRRVTQTQREESWALVRAHAGTARGVCRDASNLDGRSYDVPVPRNFTSADWRFHGSKKWPPYPPPPVPPLAPPATPMIGPSATVVAAAAAAAAMLLLVIACGAIALWRQRRGRPLLRLLAETASSSTSTSPPEAPVAPKVELGAVSVVSDEDVK